MVRFSFDPAVIVLILLGTALYVRAVRVLARRGYRVPAGQQVAWHGAMAVTAIGLLSPIDSLGEELLSAHMAQHLLIADLAAPFFLIGLRSPVYAFILPRPALVAVARRSGLRRVFRFVRRPLVAIPGTSRSSSTPRCAPRCSTRSSTRASWQAPCSCGGR